MIGIPVLMGVVYFLLNAWMQAGVLGVVVALWLMWQAYRVCMA